MREDAFRAYLREEPLTPGSALSYVSYCRSVERELSADLDLLDLSEEGIAALAIRLGASGKPRAPSARTISNLKSGLRCYERFRVHRTAPVVARPPPPSGLASSAPLGSASDTPAFLRTANVQQLLAWHDGIGEELRTRAVLRTSNGPVGDYAEHLFATAFAWRIEPNSRAGFDATDTAGRRYQIKARRMTAPTTSRQLGAFRRLPDRHFDMLAAVLFDRDYRVGRAVLVPHDVVLRRARHNSYTNSWRFMLDDTVWRLAGVRDATADLRRAADGLCQNV